MGIKQFELKIERAVDPNALGWPEHGAAGGEGLGGNRNYSDLRGFSWKEAQRVLEIEEDILARAQSSANFDHTMARIDEELDQLYEDGDPVLMGLDIGVASSVVALSAARCIPFSSCNGGGLGGYHQETFPLVSFFARVEWISVIVEAAEEANAGVSNSGNAVVVYAQLLDMLTLARGLIARRALFRQLKSAHSRRTKECHEDGIGQIALPFHSAPAN